jgi:hypothetical protein
VVFTTSATSTKNWSSWKGKVADCVALGFMEASP